MNREHQLEHALLLMCLQYCEDNGKMWNRCMMAGEEAFRVLGIENGDSAEELWERCEWER